MYKWIKREIEWIMSRALALQVRRDSSRMRGRKCVCACVCVCVNIHIYA